MNPGPVWAAYVHPVHVSEEGNLELVDPDLGDEELGVPLDFRPTGLVRTVENAAEVLCATNYGLVEAAIEVWAAEPSLATDAWQDVADVTLLWGGERMELWGDAYQEGEDLAVPVPGPGTYRLRVSGRHRDEGESRAEGAPRESYLLQLWPDTAAELPTVHKLTSATAAHWAK